MKTTVTRAHSAGIAAEPVVASAAKSHGPSLLDGTAWRDAAITWVGQRLLLVAITYIGRTLVLIPAYSTRHLSWASMVTHWAGWDGALYVVIAQQGYFRMWTARFFPLLPLLEHLVAPMTGNDAAVAGLVISNVTCLGAFGLLRVLVERETDRETARRTLLYLAVFPTSFFLAAAYAEAPFLLCCVGAFLALRRGHWLIAGALGALATLARPVGILVVVPLAAEVLLRIRAAGALPRPRDGVAILGGLALPPAALAGFSYYLYQHLGTFNAVAQAQNEDGSNKGLTWPWIGFLRAGHALGDYGLQPNFFQVHILLDATFTVVLIALVVATYRRLPLPYVLYAFAVLALLLCLPAHNWYALYANMRFTLEVFPVFMVLGHWGKRLSIERLILTFSLPLLALLTLAFVLQQWVA